MSNFAFVGPSYTARSRTLDAQRTVNLYPEVCESGTGKSVSALIGTPGLALWASLPGLPIRGVLRFSESVAIVVCGALAYSVTTAGVGTALVGAVGGSGPVSLASNGTVVAIATGTDLVFADPSSMTVTSGGYVADRVDFIDGRFVFNESGTGRFRITQAYGTTIDALEFATAEGSPDALVSLIVDHREIWLLGERSAEVWFNSGDVDFPYARSQGAYIEHGCAAAHSVAKLDNGVYWLGSDDNGRGIVMRAVGYQPQRVSTHAVELALSGYADISDAVAWTYQQEGHSFYVLSFPTANTTWVFDAATNLWHERGWTDPITGLLGRVRGACHMAFDGRNIVGDWENGRLYSLELDTYTDNGDAIHRVRTAPHLANDAKRVFVSAFQIDMETGVGLVTGQGSTPQAMLKWSDDGGFTWSSERWAMMGRIGERRTRVRWTRLGQSRDRVFMLKITDPVKVAIVGASIEVTRGAA